MGLLGVVWTDTDRDITIDAWAEEGNWRGGALDNPMGHAYFSAYGNPKHEQVGVHVRHP